jgi:hypothetical protein
MGFGIETDVRDMGGELVISHDIPHGPCFSFDAFLGLYREAQSSAWLALNIKADGLSHLIRDALEAHSVSNYFVFDASVPDFMGAAKAGLNSYLRLSDVEADETLADMAGGAWLDAMLDGYFPSDRLRAALSVYRNVALVSPELHKRSHQAAWNDWRQAVDFVHDDRVMICTDLPEEALAYFGEDQ